MAKYKRTKNIFTVFDIIVFILTAVFLIGIRSISVLMENMIFVTAYFTILVFYIIGNGVKRFME